MDYTVGIDSEKISRFSLDKLDMYANKFLSDLEYDYCINLKPNSKQRFIASRFSAKESIFKAIGVGIGVIRFKDISILNNELHKPIVNIDNYDVDVSITYNDVYVTTVAIAKKKE